MTVPGATVVLLVALFTTPSTNDPPVIWLKYTACCVESALLRKRNAKALLAVEAVLSQKAKEVPRGAIVIVGRDIEEVADSVRDPDPNAVVPDIIAVSDNDASYT